MHSNVDIAKGEGTQFQVDSMRKNLNFGSVNQSATTYEHFSQSTALGTSLAGMFLDLT